MISELVLAEEKARTLFKEAERRNFFVAGQYESELNKKLFKLAEELFEITKYWHKRIIRSGPNTLLPYKENPPDLIIQEDDIMFFDFGPVFDQWEADFGRTFVLGNDPYKLKLKNDIENEKTKQKTHIHSQLSHKVNNLWRNENIQEDNNNNKEEGKSDYSRNKVIII